MEKKQLLSVVKPLIAAALLFGSSGGVAWGQHDFRTDHNYYINGNITENGEHGDVIIRSTFSVENNYGPGETGTLTPRGGGNATKYGILVESTNISRVQCRQWNCYDRWNQ